MRALALLALAASCASPSESPREEAPRIVSDPHSYGEPNRARVEHVALELEVDFEHRRLAGSARLDLSRPDPGAPLVLDVRGLEVVSVAGPDGRPRPFRLGRPDAGLGAPLSVELQPDDRSVTVAYHTTERSDALQWLAPEQTAGGRAPFLFTQGQAVLTRTWIPLQDSPGVRVTYEAAITAPPGFTAVMSAEQLPQERPGTWRFRMDQPIPSYLIALACGELEFAPVSERCGVWAEPPVLPLARAELADTESMMQSAERLFGPYRWERYDVLILPPSFPYGGMENPRLTFATPTILAGDRSLVALVAHELAHSWSGNLVTNATWSDFWLNEGFTVYLEKRIMEEVYGVERARMERMLDHRDLVDEMRELAPIDQVLNIDLAGRHPDDGFSGVPYEKGALFLRRLEQLYGREVFDAFLNRYFDEHAFESITTQEFLAYLDRELLRPSPELAEQVDLRRWIHEPGLPEDAPVPRSEALAVVDRERGRWLSGTPADELATEGWVTQQWLHFLDGLPQDLAPERMAALDRAFGFTETGNSEILCKWLELSIATRYTAADPRLERFLHDVGRRKFLSPLYKALLKVPGGRERALELYAANRPRYHAVSTGTLDGILDWPEAAARGE